MTSIERARECPDQSDLKTCGWELRRERFRTRTLADLPYRIGHLREFFGLDRAIDITTDRARAYQRKRLEEGAAPATINRELAALRRMLSLAYNAGKLSRIPKLEMLAENNVRESFLDHATFLTLLSNLPDAVSDLVEFECLSGWRQGSAKKLEWADIDMPTHTARLRSANSKNKTGWILPSRASYWKSFNVE